MIVIVIINASIRYPFLSKLAETKENYLKTLCVFAWQLYLIIRDTAVQVCDARDDQLCECRW